MPFIHTTVNDHIATVVIDRPEALNALNQDVLAELKAAFEELRASEDLRCVILTGGGEKSFVAGADIAQMSEMDPKQAEDFGRFGNQVFLAISTFPCPVIAAVNGFALGGGFELALSCDIRLASEKARFAFPETGLGIMPGFGGTQRLARLAGPGVAADLIYTGRRFNAEEALALGVVNEVVAPEALMEKAREMASLIASRSPIGIRQAKLAIREGLDRSLEDGLGCESVAFGACFDSEDQKRAMKAFLNKEAFNDFQNR